jgi:tRNA modification GTPase
MSKNNDTIYALSTPVGKGAIAIIRISGKSALKALKKISSIKKLKPNRANVLLLKYNGSSIDQAMVLYYKTPKSFTGEDVVEINCHGGFAVINKFFKTFEGLGLRLAEPGEFTKRALLNNKIDLVKTESISDIINAETEKQREIALRNLSGELSQFTKKISEKISLILANLEALIDFSDEDLPQGILKKIKEQNKNLVNKIKTELKNSELSKPIRDGINVAIIGKPNTGKSSFINFISKKEVSIVTNLPGTTTDLITSSIDIRGIKFTFIDTAGLRRHRNKIEEIGIKKTKDVIVKSNLNLVFLEKNEKYMYKKIEKKIFIKSKSDKRKKTNKKKEELNISSITGEGIDLLLKNIYKKTIKKTKNEPILSRERHINIMKNILLTLESIKFNQSLDILAYEYRSALDLSLEINEKFDIEKILDIIFKDFCIGK